MFSDYSLTNWNDATEHNSTGGDFIIDANCTRLKLAIENDSLDDEIVPLEEHWTTREVTRDNALKDNSIKDDQILKDFTTDDDEFEEDPSTDEEDVLAYKTTTDDDDSVDDDAEGEDDNSYIDDDDIMEDNKSDKDDTQEGNSKDGDDALEDNATDGHFVPEDNAIDWCVASEDNSIKIRVDDDETDEPKCGETASTENSTNVHDVAFNETASDNSLFKFFNNPEGSCVEVRYNDPEDEMRHMAAKLQPPKTKKRFHILDIAIFVRNRRIPYRINRNVIKKLCYGLRRRAA